MNQSKNIESAEARKLELKELISRTNIIGIDIDGTLSDTIWAALAEVRRRYGDVMDFSEWKTWNPHQIPELQKLWITKIEDTIELFYGILRDGWTQRVKPIDGSVEWITKLKEWWKDLIALSGRMEDSRPYTTGWLEQYFPGVFEKILLTDHDTPKQVEKYELARQHGIWLMVEDNAYYAINLATHGIPTILLEAPWNIDIDTSAYPDIYRVKDWGKMLEILK
jgi:uncharacterized HAD superfamily protein